MDAIRVLQVIDKLSLNSGVCSTVMNYYDNMDNNKIIFDFMVHEDTPEYFRQKLADRGSKLYQMPALKTKNLIKYIKALDNFFIEHKEYKIIHGHIANASIFYLCSAKHHGVPVRIIHSHNSKGADNLIKRVRNFILNSPIKSLANSYFACSNKAADFLYGRIFVKKNKVIILNNAIDVDKYSFNISLRNKLRNKMNLNDAYIIGNVGRFCNQKNHDFLIDIFYEIHKSKKESILMLVGEGELESKIKEKVHILDLDDAVIFMGIRSDVHKLMQIMDLFVLPSLFEGLPVVGIEAQTAGLQCVFSSSITREADITGNVTFIELNDGAKIWRDKIINLTNERKSADSKKIKLAGFNIKDQSNYLSKYYIDKHINS